MEPGIGVRPVPLFPTTFPTFVGQSSVKWTKVHRVSDQSTGEPSKHLLPWDLGHSNVIPTTHSTVQCGNGKSVLINIHEHYKFLTMSGTAGKRSPNAKSYVPHVSTVISDYVA